MTPEQINKQNENPERKRGLDFIDLIEKDGYEITNYQKVTEIAELVASGSKETLRKYYSLKDLENKMGNMEELTTDFRFGVRDILTEINAVVKNDIKLLGVDNHFDKMINGVKSKLGIYQAETRVKEAEASRAKTRAAIAALDSNTTMTEKAKNAEFRRLFNIYTGPNVKAIENAKKIESKQDDNFNINLDNDFLDKISYDLKNMYDYLMVSSLSSNAKKILIDKFNKIVAMRNEYKGRLNKYVSNLSLYKKTLLSLGLSVAADKNIKKSGKPEVSINEDMKPSEKVAETKEVVDLDKEPIIAEEAGSKEEIQNINSAPDLEIDKKPDYQFANDEEKLNSESLDSKINTINQEEPIKDSPNLTPEIKPKRGKKVIAFKKAIGKLAKPVRLTAVLFITGSFLLPALGSPFGLVAGALIAVALEKTIAKKKNLENNKDRKPIKESLLYLKDKIIKKIGHPSTTPEDKNELDELDAEISAYLEKEAAKDKETELSVVSGDDQLDEEVRLAQEIMKEEGLTPEKAAHKTIEMQAEKLADDKPMFRR